MSDFVTRLAERAMGMAPVVQPLIAPTFAPEPAGGLMEPEDETATVQEVQDLTPRAQTPPETPMLAPDETRPQREERDTSLMPPSSAPDAASPAPSRQTPASGQEDLDAIDTPGPPMRPRTGEPGPLETGMESMREDRQTSSSIPPTPFAPGSGSRASFQEAAEPSGRQVLTGRSPRRESLTSADGRNPLPAPRFESAPRVEPAPERRDVEETPRRLVPKDSPSSSYAADYGQQHAMLSPTTALAEPARVTDEAPAPPPGAGDPLETGEVTPKSEIVQAHRATQGAATVVVPRIVRHQPDQREDSGPREASDIAPEPTIKVAIGRIEVRAVTPPAPARPEAPARPGPPLSLDDYLTQRNGGR